MKILVFGHSLVQGLRFPQDKHEYLLESWPCACAFEVHEEFVEAVKAVKPDAIVLCIGTNDLGYGCSANNTLADIEKMWNSVNVKHRLGCLVQEHHGPEHKLFNTMYQASDLCDAYVDFLVDSRAQGFVSDDDLHLTSDGQDAFALAIEGYVDELA